jgi:tetratricopeptide (TPR) repeat protein
MAFIKLALGILFIVLGWIYFYRPNLVLAFHQFVRESLLNDRIILLERKKLAILFFCFSFIALYMGVTSLPNQASVKDGHNWISETSSYVMYEAMQDYCREKYDNAINKYNEVLKNDPNNVTALRRLSYTYEACGDTAKARVVWQKLLKIQPNNRELIKKLGIKFNGD